jgi:large subunit ribosomal protein L20
MIHHKGNNTQKKHKKVLKLAKGYRGSSHKLFRVAVERVEKALQYKYKSRRKKKSDLRNLYINYINESARFNGINYSKLINNLNILNIKLNRKILANLAVKEPLSFKSLIHLINSEQGL